MKNYNRFLFEHDLSINKKHISREITKFYEILKNNNASIIFFNINMEITLKSEDNKILLYEFDIFIKSYKKSNININDILYEYFKNDEFSYDIKYIKKENSQNISNVIINKELSKNVSELTEGMGFPKYSYLREKIDFLSNPKNINEIKLKNKKIKTSLENKISALLLLDYLTEIKYNFNASTSGYLFESFISGLIGAINYDDNSAIDMFVPEYANYKRKNYQIKFLSSNDLSRINEIRKNQSMSMLEKIIDNMSVFSDAENYLLLGLKNQNVTVDIYLIPFNIKTLKMLYDENEKRVKITKNFLSTLKKENTEILNFEERNAIKIGTLNLNISISTLNEIKEKLGDQIKDLNENIKQLEIDVRNMIITDDKKIKQISKNSEKITHNKLKNKALSTTKKIKNKIKKLFDVLK